jgi:hypothetical protein
LALALEVSLLDVARVRSSKTRPASSTTKKSTMIKDDPDWKFVLFVGLDIKFPKLCEHLAKRLF